MIFHEFPDLSWLKQQAENNFANRRAYDGRSLSHSGWPSVILHVNSRGTYRDNIPGPLSIFTNLSGISSVYCEGKKADVHPGFFFVTNPGQRYTLEIASAKPTETFNIHFGDRWADEAIGSICQEPGELLDEPFFSRRDDEFALFNRIYRGDPFFSTLLARLQGSSPDRLEHDENLFELLSYLVRTDASIRKKSQNLPAIKSVTRSEALRRLLYATDYIYSHYDKPLSLDELARVSCFSKFHFLRLFKLVFDKAPHQFVNDVRVERAIHLLKDTTLEVRSVARCVGFSSSSSFSRMFFQQTGYYPSQVRS